MGAVLPGSVDELYGADAVVGVGVTGRDLDPLRDAAGEPAVDLAVASARVEAGDVEADPADDVVDGGRAWAGDRVVDGEQELLADAHVHRIADLDGVELR